MGISINHTFVCICELDFFVAAFMKLIPEGVSHISRDNLLAGFISLVLIAIVAAICKGYDISFYKKNLRHRKEFIAIEIIVLFINLGIIGTFFEVLNENSVGSYGNILLIMIMILSMLFSVITLIFFMAIANVREYRVIHEVNQRQLDFSGKENRNRQGNTCRICQDSFQRYRGSFPQETFYGTSVKGCFLFCCKKILKNFYRQPPI